MSNDFTSAQISGRDGKGMLVPLKTTLECNAAVKVLEVWITVVETRMAADTLALVRQIIPKDGGFDLQHLRRFAKPDTVPSHIRASYAAESEGELGGNLIFLIVGAASLIPENTLREALGERLGDVTLIRGVVPLLAPTTESQAKSWSIKYWPTVYKKSNPFGPHPSLFSRAQEEIEGSVGKWMSLAWKAAREARETGIGEGVGVVIVERKGVEERCLAIAGDARWMEWPRDGGGGNVTAHASMRAIAMVTSKLSSALSPTATGVDIFRTGPVLECERAGIEEAGDGNGYLCHELEIYCTHEPCVMCSMAIVHSRFGKVVFEKRMQGTGGLCADGGGLEHGLWWRKELNWTCLGWEFRREMGSGEGKAECEREVDGMLNA